MTSGFRQESKVLDNVGNTFRHMVLSTTLVSVFGANMSKRITDMKEVSDMNGDVLSLDDRVDLLNNA